MAVTCEKSRMISERWLRFFRGNSCPHRTFKDETRKRLKKLNKYDPLLIRITEPEYG